MSIEEDKAAFQSAEEARSKLRPGSEADSRRASNEENNGVEEKTEAPAKKSSKRRATDGGGESSMSAKRPRDSKLVRTSPALPVGAIEPFLVQKAATSSSKAPAATRATSERGKPPSGDEMVRIEHEPGCPLAGGVASIDMTQPGAFAKAICRCQVKNKAGLLTSSNTIVVRQAPEANIRTSHRPRRIEHTVCEYTSVIRLRAEVTERNRKGINEKLRNSTGTSGPCPGPALCCSRVRNCCWSTTAPFRGRRSTSSHC